MVETRRIIPDRSGVVDTRKYSPEELKALFSERFGSGPASAGMKEAQPTKIKEKEAANATP